LALNVVAMGILYVSTSSINCSEAYCAPAPANIAGESASASSFAACFIASGSPIVGSRLIFLIVFSSTSISEAKVSAAISRCTGPGLPFRASLMALLKD